MAARTTDVQAEEGEYLAEIPELIAAARAAKSGRQENLPEDASSLPAERLFAIWTAGMSPSEEHVFGTSVERRE